MADSTVQAQDSSRTAQLYARFRSGKFFFVVLVSVVVLEMSWNLAAAWGLLPPAWGFDRPGNWGTLNLFLSLEASINGTIIVIVNQKMEAWIQSSVRRQLHLAEASLAVLEELRRQDTDRQEVDGRG